MASGYNTVNHCERCGFRYRFKELRKEWTGLLVCPTCFEKKHPQLTPRKATDNQVVKGARSDQDDDGGVATQLRDEITMTFGDNGVDY